MTKARKNRQVDQRAGDAQVQVNTPLGIIYVATEIDPTIGAGTRRTVVIKVSPDGGCLVRGEGRAKLAIVERDHEDPPVSTLEGKERFVRDLVAQVCTAVCMKLDEVPGEWDGHELRELIAEYFDAERSSAVMTGRRKRAYRNEVLTRNLDR